MYSPNTKKIKKLLHDRTIYYNQGCYRRLSRKEWFGCNFILEALLTEKTKITSTDLFCKVKKAFVVYIKKVVNDYKEKHPIDYKQAIKDSELDYWCIHYTSKKDVCRLTVINTRVFRFIIACLCPLFLSTTSKGINDNFGLCVFIKITDLGKEYLKVRAELENKNTGKDEGAGTKSNKTED